MGYSGTNRMLWGDAPQDVVDAAIKKFRLDADMASIARRKQVANRLLADRALRVRVNREYMRDIGRPANSLEFKNLIKVATNLGGRTILWPKSMLKKSVRKTKKK